MNRIYVLIIRAVLTFVIAIVLMRFFYPEKALTYGIGLGFFLILMSYVSEYFHKKNRDTKE